MQLQWIAEEPEATFRELEGTFVFVDISGFTKMSERLARHGKVGAEEVTDVLGAVFARLLAVAYANDGGLIKFGGDALLLWFSGEDHAVRAARSAYGMRATLRSIGALDTTAGKVTLRMSVGVNSGRFHFFLVGGSHRELLVTGPAASVTVLMESTATAGEILLGPSAVADLPAKVLGARKGPGWLLRSEPAGLSLETGDAEVSFTAVDLTPYVPLGLRESVLASTEPEHRAATVAFVHFEGTDALIQEHGLQGATDALDELVRAVQEAVDEQGVCFLGSDVDADGGKLILTAGVPRVLGDDEERMLLALRRIVGREYGVSVKIGVNRGAVFSGDVGPPYRRTYTVMGDTVNLAARLMAKAPVGQIYASASVLDRSATRFELGEIEPFTVKGKARPVRAWSVGAAIGSRRRDERAERYTLVGRDDELAALVAALDSARSGRGRLVELVGEPGIGKTRLVEELRERADGVRVLHATAEAYASSTPYAVWRELMRELLGVGWEDRDDVVTERLYESLEATDPELMPWLPLLGSVLDVDMAPTLEVELLAPEFVRPRLHETVARFLGAILDAPTLIEIEDAHLMDAASADLLASLVAGLDAHPWLVLVTRREMDSGFVAAEGSAVLTLRPTAIGHDEAVALARQATAASPLLPHDLAIAAERSSGNPQFVLDLVRALASGSSLPDSVEAAAMVQIDMLAPGDRALVRRVSVLGLAFHPRFVADLLEEGGSEPDGSTWERLSHLFEDDGEGYLRFRRAIVRDAAYAGLPFRLRRRLHGVAGERFERDAGTDADEAAGLLSLHFLIAEVFEKAWHYARIAGERAARIYANVESARLYQRALEAGRRAGAPASELSEVAEALGDVRVRAGLFADAGRAYRDASRLRGEDRVGRARLMVKRAIIEDTTGRSSSSLTWLTKALRLLDGAAGREAVGQRAQACAWYGAIRQSQGRPSEAIKWCERAIAEAEVSSEREALAHAYYLLDWALVDLGRLDEAAHLDLALEIYEELGDLLRQGDVLQAEGLIAYFEGRWPDAVRRYEQGGERSLRAGDPVGQAIAALNVAEIRSDQGLLDEAEELIHGVLPVLRASEYRHQLAFALSILGRAASRAGLRHEAAASFAEALALAQEGGDQRFVVSVMTYVAENLALQGEGPASLSVATTTEGLAAPLGGLGAHEPLLRRICAFAHVQAGAADAAERELARGLDAARARGAALDAALALMAREQLGLHLGPQERSEVEETLSRYDVRAVPAFPTARLTA
jgi:class 3 adenylate cyclase/tetratricopeptide (TPR) repeat protein